MNVAAQPNKPLAPGDKDLGHLAKGILTKVNENLLSCGRTLVNGYFALTGKNHE